MIKAALPIYMVPNYDIIGESQQRSLPLQVVTPGCRCFPSLYCILRISFPTNHGPTSTSIAQIFYDEEGRAYKGSKGCLGSFVKNTSRNMYIVCGCVRTALFPRH